MAFSENPLFDQLVDAAVLDQPAAERLLREQPSLIHATNQLGETALHFLAVEDYAEGVTFLARHGASLNARNEAQRTPLMEEMCARWPNDPSSATRRTGRDDCNRDAPAGFAAAYG